MADEILEAQVFTDNLDRILSGMAPQDENLQADLKSALQFSTRMKNIRRSPDAGFASKLKSSLLQKLAAQEAKSQDNWFKRFFPHEPVWQIVTAAVVVIVAGVSLWATVIRPDVSEPVVNVPTITVPATTAPSTLAPATTAPATTTPSSTYAPGTYLAASASTDKSFYQPGEQVSIKVQLKNVTSQPFLLAQFPPILSLMTEDSQPAYTFQSGQSQTTLAPGETLTFYKTWDQTLIRGDSAPAGTYHLELEDIQYQGQALRLNLLQPVSFSITN
jgi:hypothetical protein